MSSFEIERRQVTLFDMYVRRADIWLDPPYQRAADIWPREKRQLLIDSLLNGFDIPKIYLHDAYPGLVVDDRRYRYAVVDGKQRLSAIWDFFDGRLRLASDTRIISDPDTVVGGLDYEGLSFLHPRLKATFDSRTIDLVSVVTDDIELIEEMFSRLNEAVPLSAPEKRNALRGPMPQAIRTLSREPFFTDALPFSNRRYRHFDIACKFLYIAEHSGEPIPDLKKAYLDDFVIRHRDEDQADAALLLSRTRDVVRRMADAFRTDDPLLQQVGMVSLYFKLFDDYAPNPSLLRRDVFETFEEQRNQNRLAAEGDVTRADYRLLEFDRYAQSPNDAIALRFRYEVLTDFLLQHASPSGGGGGAE